MDNEQLIADLKETRRQLEARGRCKGDLLKADGTVCLDGAVGAAIGINSYDLLMGDYMMLENSNRAQAVFRALVPHTNFPVALEHEGLFSWLPHEKVFYFNDLEDTTDADCFNVIDKAIAEAGGMA